MGVSLVRNLLPSRHGHAPDDPEFKLPKTGSLATMIIMNLLLQVSFFIIVPSSSQYAEYLGGSASFSGIVIGIPTLFSAITLIPLSKIDKGKYKIPLHIGCGAMVIGHLLYALAYRAKYLYLILIGRMVMGIGFTNWMYIKRYCTDSRVVGIRQRTTLASAQVIGQGVGMSAGPFFGGLLFKLGFENSVFNGYSSIGWIMAAIFIAFWVFAAVAFEDVPDKEDSIELQPIQAAPEDSTVIHADGKSDTGEISTVTVPPSPLPAQTEEPLASQLRNITLAQWGVIACMCWFAMSNFFNLGAWEANLPIMGAQDPDLHWSPYAAGNFIALGGITTFPFLLLNMIYARRLQDRKLLAVGAGLGMAGLLVFLSLVRSDTINYGSLFACWWAVALGFNLATTVTLSLLSKQLPNEWNSRTSIAIQCSNYTGRLTGAIWGGSGTRLGLMNYVGLEIAMVGIGAVLFTSLWRDLKAKTG
ncbi:MFS general substrate transporter [Coniophora puteana RWD-64-598 SS2]|uniref:MFS general substrate transporter n=1 Tax=Coniophora puteana (strain RWD-64-598) TaxID=741705 RepID=A0A5M3N7K6_CONPW|nr:MFS general substrate transporter [Coniophora puteana RWD-64-598 SS2]EIW87147.1 MFS general substrate transporter [Coniophora puteana RWD-64-598 SS2]